MGAQAVPREGGEDDVKAEGASPAIVTDHAFEPRLDPVRLLPMYGGFVTVDERHRKELQPNPYLCGSPGCNLAEAAHAK
jgi:hypothetical protein